MGFAESLIFYLLIGFGVATAVWLADTDRPLARRLFPALTAVVFWPMFVPVLLGPRQPAIVNPDKAPTAEPRDAMAAIIAQVEGELDAALSSLDGWAEEALSRQRGRIGELKSAWSSQASRIRELDRLLMNSSEENCGLPTDTKRLRSCEQARQENLVRLGEIRRQAYDDLTATLAWVRELVTMIHLAKFTGAPASRTEELVAQIAAAVEGFSEVTSWREQSSEAEESCPAFRWPTQPASETDASSVSHG